MVGWGELKKGWIHYSSRCRATPRKALVPTVGSFWGGHSFFLRQSLLMTVRCKWILTAILCTQRLDDNDWLLGTGDRVLVS